ncbi:MAG: excinuclease ABC subunit UvrC [Elusimicrobiota bacterium]
MRSNTSEVLYIGKAKVLRSRVRSYFKNRDIPQRIAMMVSLISYVDYIQTSTENAALLLEQKLINKYKPRFNIIWRDDKSYPYIKLTLNEKYPRLMVVRGRKRDGGAYYGPYTKQYEIKLLLRWIHLIFALRKCKYDFDNHSPKVEVLKKCLYYQMHRCNGPCLSPEAEREYEGIVEKVRYFLDGKHKRVLGMWKKEMRSAAEKMDFERAARVRDMIRRVEVLTERIRLRELTEPDLETAISTSEYKMSKVFVELKTLFSLPKVPEIIQCIDISTLGGKYSVGAIVTFVNGLPEKKWYRRYKIKAVTGVDDYLMMKEVVTRRFAKSQDDMPDPSLLLVDGGKGQLAVTAGVLAELNLRIPLLSLAKREEIVYSQKYFDGLALPPGSAVLQYLRRMRDEAHRFAVTYHRLLRKKGIY